MSNIKNYKYDWIWHKNTTGGFATAKKIPMKYHEVVSVFYKKLPTYNPQFQQYSESTKKRFKDGEKVNRSTQIENSTNSIQGGLSLVGEQGIEIKRGKYPESVIKIKSVPNCNGTKLHPTQKPVALMEYLIKTYTNEGELVLDFTMGSGSTGVACKNLNRNFIGIELDDKYFEIAKERINA
ncbi:MAG: site-specific DNA-methyltransferase [Candidatus Brocadiales bacterium]|nr:site-specific DNA-methyltransferase [Candidatus Brocadiales bacterium]